jgi:hypothetical protein
VVVELPILHYHTLDRIDYLTLPPFSAYCLICQAGALYQVWRG